MGWQLANLIPKKKKIFKLKNEFLFGKHPVEADRTSGGPRSWDLCNLSGTYIMLIQCPHISALVQLKGNL